MAYQLPLYPLCLCAILAFIRCDCSGELDIVFMDNGAMPKVFAHPSAWYSSVLNTAGQAKPERATQLIYNYTSAMHGFAAFLSPLELDVIKNSSGFLSSIKDKPVKLYTTRSAHFLGLTYSHGAWPASNYGEGMIIGIVDSGIWPESPSFTDHGMPSIPPRWKGCCESGTMFNSSSCNKKLIGARYFSKGLQASNPNLTITMNSPRDNSGHGTSVSSIAVGSPVDGASFLGYASGTARGIAPRAMLAMYKPFFYQNSLPLSCASDVIAAIDQTILDGVDILSLSIGQISSTLYQNPLAIATFAAMEKGVFVSMAAGNKAFPKTVDNAFPWVLTVAAGTVDREFQGRIILGNGVSISGLSLYTGEWIPKQVPLLFSEFCDEGPGPKPKIIVCQCQVEDSIGSRDKIVGEVHITDQVIELGNPEIKETPALFITPENGNIILNYINSTLKPSARLVFKETCLGTKPAPKVASYSSRGPSKSIPFILKPDLMAPGDMILGSNVPFAKVCSYLTGNRTTDFNIDSGTSLASPHVAGVAALLKKAYPEWSPGAIRSAVMTTADVVDNTLGHIKDDLMGDQKANPLAMGAGHIHPNRALDPGLVYDVGRENYINILCAMNLTSQQIKSITRSFSYNCTAPSLDLNYPSFIAYFGGTNSYVKVFHRTLTNVGQGKATYHAEFTVMDGFNITVDPNKLLFTEKLDKKSFKLTLEGPQAMVKDSVVYGYLSWIDDDRKHRVRSPIVGVGQN